jgi:hypothetical protein
VDISDASQRPQLVTVKVDEHFWSQDEDISQVDEYFWSQNEDTLASWTTTANCFC